MIAPVAVSLARLTEIRRVVIFLHAMRCKRCVWGKGSGVWLNGSRNYIVLNFTVGNAMNMVMVMEGPY